MKTQISHTVALVVLMAFGMVGCAPSFHAETVSESLSLQSLSEESLLAKTSTGRQVLSELEILRTRGYSIAVQYVSQEALASMDAKWSTFRLEGRAVTIYIDEALNLEERAHAVAHEVSRLKDDFDVEDYLRNHPQISNDVKEFWNLYEQRGFQGFDWKVIKFALGVAVCKEARAYFRNQDLSAEGLKTEKYVKGTSIGKYLSETYFARLELALKILIESQLSSQCAKYSTMTDLQKSLSW